MRLIVVRHGKAEVHSSTGKDEDRSLKPRGTRQAEFLAAHFTASDTPALILASRFERAITTAQVIQKATQSPLEIVRQLEVGYAPSSASELIAAHAGTSPLMLVGHNPQLADFIWVLTNGLPPQDSGLRTGEAVVLDVDPANLVGTGKELARIRHGDDD